MIGKEIGRPKKGTETRGPDKSCGLLEHLGEQGWRKARRDFLEKAKEKMPLARNEMSSGNRRKYQVPVN